MCGDVAIPANNHQAVLTVPPCKTPRKTQNAHVRAALYPMRPPPAFAAKTIALAAFGWRGAKAMASASPGSTVHSDSTCPLH
jgi:hypothetical protein